MHEALHVRDDIDCMSQKKEEKENLLALRIVLMHLLKNYIKKSKGISIIAASNGIGNRITEKQQKRGNRNRKKKQLHGYFK